MNCKENKPKDEVFEIFTAELTKQNYKIDSITNDGRYAIDLGTSTILVSLENLRRNYLRDKDSTLITDFVLSLYETMKELPPWDVAKDSIYFSLFSSDFEFNKAINEAFTKELNKVFIYSRATNNEWLINDNLNEWNISIDVLKEQAVVNSNRLLHQTKVILDTVDGRKLGFFELKDETLKPTLLFATNLREKVRKDFGWPIYMVIPARDFSYIFSEKDLDFFVDRIGNIVLKEFNESGYPISTEILKISEEKIEAIGKISEENKNGT